MNWINAFNMNWIKVFNVLVLLLIVFNNRTVAQKLVVDDPLSSTAIVKGEIQKISTGGLFTDKGWQAIGQGDYLMIEVSDEAGFEGSLNVDILNLNGQIIGDKDGSGKIHFLSMFSNSVADHHAEDGATSNDALWTLRTGFDENGNPRYGQNFKILWASKGAKRTENNDYHEEIVQISKDWKWVSIPYTFTVRWSQKGKSIEVFIDGNLVFRGQWLNQVSPLRYIYLAKSPDFNTLVGSWFSNLKVYAH